MKIQSQAAYTYKGKKQMKFWIVLSKEIIRLLGWKKGNELEHRIEGKKLILLRNSKK